MQFAVPQFTDVEDKLIGPLTLKQFLILLATGGVIMFFYSVLGLNIFFFVLALPLALFGLFLAFGRFNGRPIMNYVGAFINYVSKPQVRVFKREEVILNYSVKTTKKEEEKVNKLEEVDESRLKKLAYLLDQKTQEEKELLEKKQ